MFVATYTNPNILEIDLITKKIEVFEHEATASQPNDIAIAQNKSLYTSDIKWSDDT